ncbi:hypothetical protein EXIGLDRAFT_832486 [Exidia glandulosa HHB12029]|uniref:F-box domain-containing protein n=1 Tax=Exidia glandulosa HHB12029 TaxID=1314781 RepID=A0A165LM37_EXIGL|nr:hypothetical protein EXIGLDRAFT_832486 [Exidia glandulosa HHB12029]
MSALPTLPPELLLFIAESAAASEPPTRLGSAAALPRVCKSLHRAVTPILYAHIVFTRHNFRLLAKLALDSSVLFAYVRSVTVPGSLPSCGVDDLQSITRAMTHLRAFTGSIQALVFVLEASDDLCLSSISVTGFVDPLALARTTIFPSISALATLAPALNHRTMQDLIALPHELHLLVAEHAARSNVYLRAVVAPILYTLISVRDSNYQNLVNLSRQQPAPLALTRGLHIGGGFGMVHNIAPIIRAMPRLDAVTCRSRMFDRIHPAFEDRIPSSITFWDVMLDEVFLPSSVIHAISTAAQLHINVFLHRWAWKSSLIIPAEYLVIDAHCVFFDSTPPRGLDQFLQKFDTLIAESCSLQRILLRARCEKPDVAAVIIRGFVGWAEEKRDPRIWVDDSIVRGVDDLGNSVREELGVKDALAGDALWLMGRQVFPGTL